MKKLLLLILSLFTINVMPHAPRHVQAPNTAADFWAKYNSTNPRMSVFVLLTPTADWTGVSAVGLTSNTRDMTLPGHPGITFKAAPGIAPTVVETALGETANMELTGVYQTGIFEREDVLAGKWQFAGVEVFVASWDETDLGELLEFKGYIGDFKDYGTYFTAEGRGLIGLLSNEVGEVTQRLCRVYEFGDTRCGKVLTGSFTYDATTDHAADVFTKVAHGMRTGEFVSLSVVSGSINGGLTANTGYYVIRNSPDTYKFATTLANARAGTNITGISDAVGVVQVNRGIVIINGTVYNMRQASVPGIGSISGTDNAAFVIVADTTGWDGNDPLAADFPTYTGYFKNGTIKALDGPNAGIKREIAAASEATGGWPYIRIETKRGFPYPIDSTTNFQITMGCTRTMEDCRKYANADRFNGEPYVPGIESANRILSGN